ncbi:hypothetical protein [Carboxylicivirga marina]|uniref:Porin n=1 Tax=Carboxylicivirga marina TaxID=2800988 RepID=A0ABS1HHD4_9BACT|nr:hypothetical protein [Carboxylicivirga marina]MBK3516885.1 hypothetical protein [Carboxylicivirga marina]
MTSKNRESIRSLMKILLAIIIIGGLSNRTFAQETANQAKGQFYGDVFFNANHNFDAAYSSFRLNRLHFAYKYQYNQHLYFNGMVESARENYEPTGDYNNITNLFEFCFGFHYEKFEGKAGLIGTQLNQQQEALWKHRYIDKVFADKYGFAPTNDYGVVIKYKPTEVISFDMAITNGEGHKNAQVDSVFRYAVGATLNTTAGLVVRAYADFLNQGDATQTNFIGILGYQSEAFTAGVEYNQQLNSAMQSGIDLGGLSAYASYNINERYQLFGRYDVISYNYSEGELPDSDGSLAIIGGQYQITNQITTSLNYRMQELIGDTSKAYLYLNLALEF